MAVTAGQIIRRGITLRCPNCGGRTLFRHWLAMHDRCARCGLRFEREPGFFLGALVINYTVTLVLLLVPMVVLVFQQKADVLTAVVIGFAWSILFPLAFFPTSKSLWLMTYYVFFPRQLPANGGTDSATS